MRNWQYALIILILGLVSLPADAQQNPSYQPPVEVDFDALNTYQPPPMFDAPVQEQEHMPPQQAPVQKKEFTPPLNGALRAEDILAYPSRSAQPQPAPAPVRADPPPALIQPTITPRQATRPVFPERNLRPMPLEEYRKQESYANIPRPLHKPPKPKVRLTVLQTPPRPTPKPIKYQPEPTKQKPAVATPLAVMPKADITEDITQPPVEIVKGPKTMPAVQAENVKEQTVFNTPSETDDTTLLNRHIANAQLPNKQEPIDLMNVTPASTSITQMEDDITKITLSYKSAQTELELEDMAAIQRDILDVLPNSPEARLQIQAFASPVDEGLSSDRRIALSRALALRAYLLEQGIRPSQIDVRALGSQTSQQPVDRIDIYMMHTPSSL